VTILIKLKCAKSGTKVNAKRTPYSRGSTLEHGKIVEQFDTVSEAVPYASKHAFGSSQRIVSVY
jgi:hypothetical protein